MERSEKLLEMEWRGAEGPPAHNPQHWKGRATQQIKLRWATTAPLPLRHYSTVKIFVWFHQIEKEWPKAIKRLNLILFQYFLSLFEWRMNEDKRGSPSGVWVEAAGQPKTAILQLTLYLVVLSSLNWINSILGLARSIQSNKSKISFLSWAYLRSHAAAHLLLLMRGPAHNKAKRTPAKNKLKHEFDWIDEINWVVFEN